MRQDTATPLALPRALPLCLALRSRGYSVEGAARALGINSRHLHGIIRRERHATQALLERLRALIGAPAWDYACEATDRLPLPRQEAA